MQRNPCECPQVKMHTLGRLAKRLPKPKHTTINPDFPTLFTPTLQGYHLFEEDNGFPPKPGYAQAGEVFEITQIGTATNQQIVNVYSIHLAGLLGPPPAEQNLQGLCDVEQQSWAQHILPTLCETYVLKNTICRQVLGFWWTDYTWPEFNYGVFYGQQVESPITDDQTTGAILGPPLPSFNAISCSFDAYLQEGGWLIQGGKRFAIVAESDKDLTGNGNELTAAALARFQAASDLHFDLRDWVPFGGGASLGTKEPVILSPGNCPYADSATGALALIQARTVNKYISSQTSRKQRTIEN